MTVNNKQALKKLTYIGFSLISILLSSGAQASPQMDDESSSEVASEKLKRAFKVGAEMREKYSYDQGDARKQLRSKSTDSKSLLGEARELDKLASEQQSDKRKKNEKAKAELEYVEKSAFETLLGFISTPLKQLAREAEENQQIYEERIRRPTEQFNARKRKEGFFGKLFNW